MNEEYKHIAIEVTRWCEANDHDMSVDWVWEEKFAELIIKECLQICIDVDESPYGYNSVLTAHKIIKQHFGVTDER
jgi:hypothetical protein